MGFMVKSYFAANALLAYPLLALGLFVLVFVSVVVRTVLTSKSEYDSASRLPFAHHREDPRD